LESTRGRGTIILAHEHLLGPQCNTITALDVRDAHRGNRPLRLNRGRQTRRRRDGTGVRLRQVGQHVREILGQGNDLLLLDLKRDNLAASDRLKEERPVACRANRASYKCVNIG
jgi:hypothetical protein